LSGLHDHLAAGLPAYARPVFIRICQTLDITGTFKLQKQQLTSESYAPPAADPVWLYDRRQGAFIACDAQLRQSIAAGKLSNL
jgi:fatty-acyl-CoA synthase